MIEKIILGCILIFLFAFITIVVIISLISVTSKEYTTNDITECNDVDGDVIEGDIICYEVIRCSNDFLWLQDERCEDYIE